MKIKNILNEISKESNIKYNKDVSFFTIYDVEKNPVMALRDQFDEVYVIERSKEKYERFINWENKTGVADIQLTGKKIKTRFGKLPLVKIKVEVEDPRFKKEKKEPVF